MNMAPSQQVSASCYLGHGGVLYAAKGAIAGPKVKTGG